MTELPAFAVLASGAGSNAMALAAAARDGEIPARLACIVTDRPEAGVVERARQAGIETLVIDRARFSGRDAHEAAIVAALQHRDVRFVALAGYMRICGPVLLSEHEGRMLNIHPSLLPAFPGRDSIGSALAAGIDQTGVTVHFVDRGVDTGPVICQEPVPIARGDDHASLALRIHAIEHRLYPRALAALARGEIALTNPTLQEASPA